MTLRTVKVPIIADLSNLKKADLEMLSSLQGALSIIDRMHLLQAEQMYPPGLTKQQIEKDIKFLKPKAVQRIKDPQTRLVYKGDSLTGLPSVDSTDLNDLETWLWRAALDCRTPDLRDFLSNWVENMRRGRFDENNRRWLDLKDDPFQITIGPYETYMDEILGVKTTYEGFIGIVRPRETADLQYYQQKALEYDAVLAKHHGFTPYRQTIRMVVVDEILTAGFARYEYSAQAYILPNEETFVSKYGAKQVFMYNVMRAKFESLSRPVAERIMPEIAGDPAFNFERHFGFVSGHETGHGISIKLDDPAFAEIGSKLEEFKADVNGLLFKRYCNEKTPEAEFELMTFVADCFRRAHTNPTEAHAVGNLVFLNRAIEEGALKIAANRIHFDPAVRLWSVLEILQNELITIGMKKDYRGGKLLLDRWGTVTQPIQSILDSLADLPQDIEVVHQDFRGNISPHN